MSDESMWRAVHAMNDAAQRAHGAADRLEQATQQLRVLFEDGYGGNALKLIELLEGYNCDQKPVLLPEWIITIATEFANELDNFAYQEFNDDSAPYIARLTAAIEASGGKVES